MSPLWLMDYGSDATYVIHQYALIQWTAFLVPGMPSQSQGHYFYMSKKSENSYVSNCFLSVFF